MRAITAAIALATACGASAPASAPRTEPPNAEPPNAEPSPAGPGARADRCRAGELHPCGCVNGKGHRACTNGVLGKCICLHDPVPAEKVSAGAPETAPASASRTPGGVPFVILKKGSGSTRVGPNGKVTVHYAIWDGSGKKIDDSWARGRPAVFPVRGVVPGFAEVLQVMVVGDRVRAWIPPALAYKNAPGRPQGTLRCDIELLRIW